MKEKLGLLLIAAAVVAAYSNHFHNSFHFDDSHTVEHNVYLRDVRNIPLFFVDATTISVLPENRCYRPLLAASLAVDYWLAGSLKNMFFFHLSTFLLFLVLLVSIHSLYCLILAGCSDDNALVARAALFMTAWFGLHPACAETINYICQRAEVQSTLGSVLGLLIYVRYPSFRCFGLYLIPVVVGALAKPLAIMFGPIALVYYLLFEEKAHLCFWMSDFSWRAVGRTLKALTPALLVCVMLYALQAYMMPSSYTPGGTSFSAYIFTQPWVYLYYVRSLFLPTSLSADSDWSTLEYGDPRAWVGIAFCILLAALMMAASRKPLWRPFSFGLAWFILALAPTTFVPLAEVVNDHRMFFPFIGLVLAVVWPAAICINRCLAAVRWRHSEAILALCSVLFLAPYAYGTRSRNEVWSTEETLWKDTVAKSPRNGRALMNYGLIFMEKGDYRKALDYFERASIYNPSYHTLEVNLGIAAAGLGYFKRAERHFLYAQKLAPDAASSYLYYARWLMNQGRIWESLQNLRTGLEKVPANFDIRHLLMKAYSVREDWFNLRKLSEESLRIAPADSYSAEMKSLSEAKAKAAVQRARRQVESSPSGQSYLTLSYVLHQAGLFKESIEASRRVLEYDASSAEAYNNIASAHAALGEWDQAIEQASMALKLNPDYRLARNNLQWALEEKKKAEKR